MASGQQVLTGVLDVGAVNAVEARLADRELGRHAVFGAQLRDALVLHRLYSDAGCGLAAGAQLALVLGCSEWQANRLLQAAQVLSPLPGAVEAVECGLLTVEQAQVLVAVLVDLPEPARPQVWEQLQARLLADADRGGVLPPARLRSLLRGWVIAADPVDAEERRKRAEANGDVDYRQRDDGLVDLFAFGISGPNAQACLSRIAEKARPWGPEDDRTAGARRRDALVDLLTGRTPISFPGGAGSDGGCEAHGGGCPDRGSHDGSAAVCGCPLSSPVPCGAQLSVLVPLGAALGVTDEPAELVGHGPIEPDLLAGLLSAAPALRAVWVDPDGVPVAAGDRVLRPGRGDPDALRTALLTLAGAPPGPLVPRHPDDHPPPDDPPDDSDRPPGEGDPPDDGGPRGGGRPGNGDPPSGAGLPGEAGPPGDGAPPGRTPTRDHRKPVDSNLVLAAAALGRPQVLTNPHPAGTPGPYRVPARLRRLLHVRAPRCEWPGCGARAAGCDRDHDLAWPYGPTCGCNLGALCRRHHRVKQLGWTKLRNPDGVRWMSPTGRSWLSPVQHQPPQPAIRPLPPARPPEDELDTYGPLDRLEQLWLRDPSHPMFDGPDDHPDVLPADPADSEPADELGDHLRDHDTRWTLDLDDPYRWTSCV